MNLDAAFSAMADPTRRGILARLTLGEATVMEFVCFSFRHDAARYILAIFKVLEGAGLIVRRVEGTQTTVPVTPSAIVEIDQWLDTLRQALIKNYDRLDDVLAGMNAKKRKARR